MTPHRRLPNARRRHGAASVALLALVLLIPAACGGPEEPVAELAVDASRLTLPYPESRELVLTWRPRAELPTDAPRVFVHLLNAEGTVERTFDHPFPQPWRPGTEVSYPLHLYQSMLGPPLAAGEYRLTVGLHGSDDRWPLATDGPAAGRREYRVATVEVPGPRTADLPSIDFRGAWLPLEPGTDRQVLGSRWLGAEGVVAVEETASPGRLGLLFETPEPPAGVERTVEGPGDEPCLKVESTCDGSERRLSGTGLSPFEVAVPAGEPCEIRLQPNFRLDHPDFAGKSARLLVLTWDPAEG